MTTASGAVFQAAVPAKLDEIPGRVSPQGLLVKSPDAAGNEVDPRVAASLDFIRDRLQEGKPGDALQLLEKQGDPDLFKDGLPEPPGLAQAAFA